MNSQNGRFTQTQGIGPAQRSYDFRYGSCCAEMDLWEANSRSQAYTTHPCDLSGAKRCEGTECGDNESGERYRW